MKTEKLAGALLKISAVLAVLTAFAVLDWYPALKDLGQLRRERSDLQRTIQDVSSKAGTLVFPDDRENLLLAGAVAELRRALLPVENDAAWQAMVLTELQAQVDKDLLPHARLLFRRQVRGLKLATAEAAGGESLLQWLEGCFCEIQDGFSLANDPKHYHWRGMLADGESSCMPAANRPLCVAAMAPLPALLGFINHLSWSELRLEIIRLHLEVGSPYARAWVVCRGTCRLRVGSLRFQEAGEGEGLLVDPESPLLLRPADPRLVPDSEKKELPMAGGAW